jgi:hypothetical protein
MRFFKTITALYVLLLLNISITNAQQINTKDGLKNRFGFKGGLNSATLFADDVDNTKSIAGFNVGLFAKLPLTTFISIQPELYYTTKGADITYNNLFVNGTARFNLNYIELPILVAINITKNFNVHAGPYAAFLVNGKVSNRSNVGLFNFEDNIEKSDYNEIDFGLAAGLGVDFGSLGIGVRYSYGLKTVGKEKSFAGTNYTFPNAQNGVLNLYLSLSIN